MGICFDVPGRGSYHLDAIVFDLNGTLTVDGRLSPSTSELLFRVSEKVALYVLTADTQSSASRIQDSLGEGIQLMVLSGDDTTRAKRRFVQKMDSHHVAAVGNGANDAGMLEEAVLGIAVLEEEGCAAEILLKADIAVRHIDEALGLFLNPGRLIATLRR